MAESFLEEQLKRIREMTEQMTRIRDNAAELTDELARGRESGRQDPWHDARDLRKYSYPDPETYRPEDRARKARRHVAHDSPRRRRRR
jgi:hypothetical protein